MALSVIFSAAALIFSGFAFIYFQAYLRRRTGAERILIEFEEEVNKLIAGIDAATDRNITLLEDKAKAIKALLETLDRRIAVYARELDRRSAEEKAGRFIRSATPLEPTPPLTERVRELSRNGFSPETIAARLSVTLAEVDLALALAEKSRYMNGVPAPMNGAHAPMNGVHAPMNGAHAPGNGAHAPGNGAHGE